MSTVNTYTGRRVDVLHLRPEDIDIRDIAHALALCNRFAGHTAFPISVAQHSVHVSLLCDNSPFAIQALLHDASEAYLGDVTKWLKKTEEMAAYRDAEARAQHVIFQAFGCPKEIGEIVKWADDLMVRYEFEVGLPGVVPPAGYGALSRGERRNITGWRPMSWQVAESTFLSRFFDLRR